MICIPVMAATQAEALQIIKESAGLADVLELRMDLLADGRLGELVGAIRDRAPAVKILVTNRPGPASSGRKERQRIALLKEAVSLGVDYVDVELTTAAPLREEICKLIAAERHRTALIVSHHDYQGTPAHLTLLKYFKESVQAGARVVKIATLARTPEDNLAVLSLIPYARRHDQEIVAFCMGEQGRISRVMAPLLGALFTFASLRRGAETAPGQLSVGEMKQIFKILDNKVILEG